MKILKIFLFLVLTSQFLLGQNNNKYAGFIKIQDTLLIKYKLEFIEDNGTISGFSLTDFGGAHETKSKIVGRYDKESKLLSFKEVEIIYTKSPVSLDAYDFCNVNFEPSKFKLGADKLSGDFKGRFSDGKECIDGELAMSSVEKIANRINKFTNRVQKSKRIEDSTKQKVQNLKILDTINLNVLKKGEVTSVIVKSSDVNFLVYDAGQIDDDIVTIKQDGKSILSKYRITDKKKILSVNMNKEKISLTIHSDSEGTIGSNTAIIEIVNGDNTIKTMTNLKKGETTKIDLLQKQ